MKQETLTIHGISPDGPACLEALGLSKVFAAYAYYCVNESIMDSGVGFNPNSGYVYIALENGISICSCMAQDVEYLVTNFDNGEEHFFSTYSEALEFEPINE